MRRLTVILALLICVQAYASNFPLGLAFQPQDASGKNYPGALLYHYNAGTAVLKNTYSDHNLATAQANPIVADSKGKFPAIYLLNNSAYRFILKTSAGVTLWTLDDIYGNQSEYGTIVAGTSTDGTSAVTGTNTGAGVGVAGVTSGGTGFALSGTGNATRAPLYLAPQSAPATTTKGSVWVNSSTGSLSVYDGTAERRTINQLHAIAATETRAYNVPFSTSKTTIAANTLRVGQTIRIKAYFRVTAVADGVGTATITCGPINYSQTWPGPTGLVVYGGVGGKQTFVFDSVITILTTGAGGTANVSTNDGDDFDVATAIDTTVANDFQWLFTTADMDFSTTLYDYIVDISS